MAEREGGVARIGQFKVGPNIGEGTFGLVKLGTHIQTQEKVAIKVLEKVKIASKEDLHRVRREIKILKSLRHPHIIQLYEIIEDMENIYLIMEYASKGELFNYIVEHTKLQETEACRLYQQIISAMEYFHRLNIAHRDLKPENLFLDDNYNIKVGDFGLSNYFGSDCLLKTSCGSPCYAAPEMISDRPYSGITVDIWASGVVLYAMLCGYLPFNYPEDQTSILFREIRKGNYKIPPFVGKDARNLIKNILNIDNRTRYTVSQIKSHPWYGIHPNFRHQYQGVIVGVQAIPIDNHILNLVTTFGYEIEQVRKDLSENRHNSSTSLYYLLLASQKRLGYITKKDICSREFVPEPVAVIQQTAVPQPVVHVSPLRVDSTAPSLHMQPSYQPSSLQSTFHYQTATSAPLNTQPNLGQIVNSSNAGSANHLSSSQVINRRSAAPSIAPTPHQGYSPMVQIFSSRDSSRDHSQSVKGVLSLNTTLTKEGQPGLNDLPTTQSLYMPPKYTEKHSSAKEIGNPYYGLQHSAHGGANSHSRTVDVQVPSYAIGTHPQKIVVQTLNTQVELYDKPVSETSGQTKPAPVKDAGPAAMGSTEAQTPTLSPVEKPVIQPQSHPVVPEPKQLVAQWIQEPQSTQQPSKVTIETKIPVQVVNAAPERLNIRESEATTSPEMPSKNPLTGPTKAANLGIVHSEKKPSSLATKANIYNKVEINFITNNFNNPPPAEKVTNLTKEATKIEPKPALIAPIYASSARVLPHPTDNTLSDRDLSHDDRMFMTQRTVGAQPSEDLTDHPALLYNAPAKLLGTVIGRGSGDTKRDDTKYRSLVELGPSKQGTTRPKQLLEGTKIARNFASILSQPASGKLISASQTQIANQVEPLALSLRDSLTGISKGFAKRKNTAGVALQTIQTKVSTAMDTDSPVNKTKTSQNIELLQNENGSVYPNTSGLMTPAGGKIAKTFSKPLTSGKRVQAGNILRGITLGGGTPANPAKKKLQSSVLNDYSTGGNTDRKLSTNLETSSAVSGLLDQIRQKQHSNAVSFLNTTSKELGETAKQQTKGSFKLLNLSGTRRRPSMNTSIGIRKPTAELVSLYNNTEGGVPRGLSLEGNTSAASQQKQTKPDNSEYLGLRSGSKGAAQPQSNVVPPLFASKWSQERKIWINCKPVNLALTSFLPAEQLHAKVLHAAKQLVGLQVHSGADYSVRIPSGTGEAVIQVEEIEDCPGLHTISLYSDLQGLATKIVASLLLDD